MTKHSVGFYPAIYYEIRKRGVWYRDTQQFCSVLWHLYKPNSVADVGCGPGVYLKCFQDLGAKTTLGLEGHPSALRLVIAENVIQHDLRVPFSTSDSFKLVLCIEVAEHIEENFSNVFLQTIASLCDQGSRLIFSAARPGQPGLNHVNLQPRAYWINKLKDLGFVLSEEETSKIVRLFHPKFVFWLKNNLLCFQYLGKGPGDQQQSKLKF